MNLFKRFLDSRWAWDWFMGPVYNRRIWDAAGHVITELIERLPPPPGAKVLDLGSGPGFATRLLAERHPFTAVIGVDHSPRQVRWAKRHVAKHPVPNCSFLVANAMDQPFADNTFDFVCSVASIKHWPDAVRGLREIARVLKPGCSTHLVEADREFDAADLDEFVRAFAAPWWVYEPVVSWYAKTTVFGQSLSCAEAERMARDAGFAEVFVEKIPGPFLRMELRNTE